MLYKLKKDFDERHDFCDDDIEVLKGRWPEVSFHNIPAAWIIPIDQMLCRMRYHNQIKEIRQDFGQFIVIHNKLRPNHEKILKRAEQEIYEIDVDLQKQLQNYTIFTEEN